MRPVLGTRTGSRVALVLIIAMAMLVLAPAAAGAAQPEVVRAPLVFFFAEGDPDGVTDCDGDGSNDYTIDLEGRLVAKFWPDGKEQFHFNWDGLAFTTITGETVRIHHAFTITIDDGVIMVTGLPFGMFEDPGGPIVMDAGLVRVDADGVFVAGPHELLEEFGLDANAATCDALGL